MNRFLPNFPLRSRDSVCTFGILDFGVPFSFVTDVTMC